MSRLEGEQLQSRKLDLREPVDTDIKSILSHLHPDLGIDWIVHKDELGMWAQGVRYDFATGRTVEHFAHFCSGENGNGHWLLGQPEKGRQSEASSGIGEIKGKCPVCRKYMISDTE